MFCKEICFATNTNVKDANQQFILTIEGEETQWSLRKVLMQLAHPEQEECSFFQAIDHNRNGNGITVAMLPNIVQHGSTAVRHLLPFTKWILEPTLGPTQARNVEVAFMADTVTWQLSLQWDPTNNCVLQADSTLIDKALNDFPRTT